MKRTIFLFFILFSLSQHPLFAHFETLKELQAYAATHQEDVPSETTDPFYPEFTQFYENNNPTLFGKMLIRMGLMQPSGWNPLAFKQLLQELTPKQLTPMHQEKEVSHKTLEIPTGANIIFFGDLYGAYHSLTRSLAELKHMGIIDENLGIIKENHFIIFLGNVINQSPYSLETLTVILNLLKKNPEKVIYIQGDQEVDGHWENYTMRNELKAFASEFMGLEDYSIPFKKSINDFFATLPKRVSIHHKGEAKEEIFSVHRDLSEDMLKKVTTEALIMGSQETESIRTSGLQYRGFYMSTPIWSLISCPVFIFRSFYKFHYDSFAIFGMGETIVKSSITAYDQDIDKKEGFKKQGYDIMYGIKVKGQEQINTIHARQPYYIGSSFALQGGAGATGFMFAQGIETAVNNFNQNGGHDGLYIKTCILDDQFDPKSTRANIEFLMKEYHIDTILLPWANIQTYINLAKEKKIIVLFPADGTLILQDPKYRVINFTGTFKDEVKALIEYEIVYKQAKKFAFFYSDDEFGKVYVELAHEELKARGIKEWTDLLYNPDQTDFKEQVALLKKAASDVIGCFSIGATTQEFFAQVGADFLMGRNLFGNSSTNNNSLRSFLQKVGISMIFSTDMPDPKGDIEILKEYRKAMDRIGLPYDGVSLEPFMTTSIFLDAVNHMKPNFTKEDVLHYLESMKNYNFKGITLTFNSNKRSFEQPIWLHTADDKWWFPFDVKTLQFQKN